MLLNNEKLNKILACLLEIKDFVSNYREYDRDEDFCVLDACGCNMDDAYQMGVNDGEKLLSGSIRNIISGYELDDLHK